MRRACRNVRFFLKKNLLTVSLLAGMPVTSVRELRVLQTCRHKNLVELKGVVTGSKLDRHVLCCRDAITV